MKSFLFSVVLLFISSAVQSQEIDCFDDVISTDQQEESTGYNYIVVQLVTDIDPFSNDLIVADVIKAISESGPGFLTSSYGHVENAYYPGFTTEGYYIYLFVYGKYNGVSAFALQEKLIKLKKKHQIRNCQVSVVSR